MRRRVLAAVLAFSCVAALVGPQAHAQAPAVPPAASTPPASVGEFQGASCLVGGVAATAVTATMTRGVMPIVASLVAGCAIGWLAAPSLLGILRKMQ